MYAIFFISSLLFLLGVRDNPVFAHGAHYTIGKAEAMVIRVEYDDGQPMSYAEVKIFSPDDPKVEYQNGRTDKNGRFSFWPEEGGEWKVTVSDGLGHSVVANIWPDDKGDTELPRQSSGFKRWQKAIMALCVVWGFLGLAFFLQAKTMRRQ